MDPFTLALCYILKVSILLSWLHFNKLNEDKSLFGVIEIDLLKAKLNELSFINILILKGNFVSLGRGFVIHLSYL